MDTRLIIEMKSLRETLDTIIKGTENPSFGLLNTNFVRCNLYDYIVSRDTFDISDICSILDKGIDEVMTKLLIGKRVTTEKDGTWLIIGVNHDNTINTIDLRSEVAVTNKVFDINSNNIYEESYIRKYLNGEYLDNFGDDIKYIMQYMNVSSNDKILYDKVKLLSMTELGLEDYSPSIVKGEGTLYPYINHMIKDKDEKYCSYMTRSRCTDYRYILRIDIDGEVGYSNGGYDRAVVPVIRLKLND